MHNNDRCLVSSPSTPPHGQLYLHIIQPQPVHELSISASELTYSLGSLGAGSAMDLSPFATLSRKKRQANKDQVADERRRGVAQALAVHKKYAHATRALEEAGNMENTQQAQDKEPRSSDFIHRRPSAGLRERTPPVFQQQVRTSTYIEGGEPVTYYRALEDTMCEGICCYLATQALERMKAATPFRLQAVTSILTYQQHCKYTAHVQKGYQAYRRALQATREIFVVCLTCVKAEK